MTKAEKEKFLLDVYPYAIKAGQSLNVDPAFIATHWAHESGYGSNKGFKNNNLAGLYAYDSSPYGLIGKSYDSMDSFVGDYVSILQNKRYNLSGVTDITSFAQALKNGGYASDPNYAYSDNWTEGFNLTQVIKNITMLDKPLENGTTGYYNVVGDDGENIKVPIIGRKQIGFKDIKDVLLGDYVSFENGIEIKNNINGGSSTPLIDTTNSTVDEVLNGLKLPFVIVVLIVLLMFFLYAIFIKGSDTEKNIQRAGMALATDGMSEVV